MKRIATDQERRALVRAVKLRLQHDLTHSMRESRWTPQEVFHPKKKRDRVFVAREAWDFIAECLESGVEIEVIKLDIPKDADGWVMKVPTDKFPRPIYIKLQLNDDGFVLGRSFHYSDPR
jgi:hypothetical protein